MKTHTLLGVDDRAENLFVLKQLIAEHLPECSLVTAESAQAGLAMAAGQSFDGALIDVQMPVVDGIEMCRQLKTDEASGDLPVLLVTAHDSTTELRIRGLEAGADDFISRPIDNVELVAKIRVMLRIKRAEDELRAVNAHLEESVAERTEALRDSETRYRAIFEQAADSILVIDSATGALVDFNERAHENLGYTREEFKSLKIPDFVAVESAEEVREHTAAIMREGADTFETRHRTKDGRIRDILVSSRTVTIGNRDYAVSICRDITNRKKAEHELTEAKEAAEAANRAKGQFLANMSHEIRTPMTAIMGYTDLLLSDVWPPAERRKYLQTVNRHCRNLLEIINDILDLSKIESEEIELELAECSVSEIVEEVRSLLQISANEKQLGLDVHYREPLPGVIRADSVRLRQILVNLVGNAIKFTEKGLVKITVGSTRQDDGSARMQFEVTDTGIGISAEEIDRIFEPFTQADMTFTRRFGGTGLGLAISGRLARLLGGQIEVRSEPGKGSTFTLTIDAGPLEDVRDLPVLPADSAKEREPTATDQVQPLHGRVLLAEDDPDLRALLARNLRTLGPEVDTAENGRIAYEMALASRAEGRPYGLILMDIQMPELDGYEATRRLRRDGWKGPIVAATAHVMDGDREKCLKAGCDEYLSKPVTLEELSATVARYLSTALSQVSLSEPLARPQSGPPPDPESADLVKTFSSGLSTRMETIERAFHSGDFSLVGKLAHQLKGTAGGFGFPVVARTAEQLVKHTREENDSEKLEETLSELTALCKHVVENGDARASDVARHD